MPRPRREPLTRSRIVAASLRLLDAEGMPAFTMRRLAHELDSSAMSLYRHVDDREHLLTACLDEVAGELGRRPRAGGPRERLLTVFTEVHEVLGRHAWVAEILAGGGAGSVRALVIVEEVLVALREAGLGDHDAALGYVALWQYTLGHLVVDHARPQNEDDRRATFAKHVADYPVLAAIVPVLTDLDYDRRFSWGLSAMVNGILDVEARA